MVIMKGLLCKIILKIHNLPPPQSLYTNVNIQGGPVAGDALTALPPICLTEAVLPDILSRNGRQSVTEIPCRPAVYDCA